MRFAALFCQHWIFLLKKNLPVSKNSPGSMLTNADGRHFVSAKTTCGAGGKPIDAQAPQPAWLLENSTDGISSRSMVMLQFRPILILTAMLINLIPISGRKFSPAKTLIDPKGSRIPFARAFDLLKKAVQLQSRWASETFLQPLALESGDGYHDTIYGFSGHLLDGLILLEELIRGIRTGVIFRPSYARRLNDRVDDFPNLRTVRNDSFC
jgi:hypothetical protein